MECPVGVRIKRVPLYFNAHSQQDILVTVSPFPIFCLRGEKIAKRVECCLTPTWLLRSSRSPTRIEIWSIKRNFIAKKTVIKISFRLKLFRKSCWFKPCSTQTWNVAYCWSLSCSFEEECDAPAANWERIVQSVCKYWFWRQNSCFELETEQDAIPKFYSSSKKLNKLNNLAPFYSFSSLK